MEDLKSIFVEGRNCWRRTHANRIAFLIDGEAYFKAFKEAALNARRPLLCLRSRNNPLI
jgi:phosphatidylserine/phosphatidylglycerophosphate/cardiolipin synthase-like enzyme